MKNWKGRQEKNDSFTYIVVIKIKRQEKIIFKNIELLERTRIYAGR
jgi:hypothetical protein